MADKMPIAVLISGKGRTLKNLLNRINEGTLDIEIRLVVASSRSASGLQYAEMANIPIEIVESVDFATTEDFSRAVFSPCRAANVKYVAMAGYLKYLAIPEDFRYRVLNIHPSLMPAFSENNIFGYAVHEQAFERGVKVSGCTVHFVDNNPAVAPIILQRSLDVKDDDTIESLSDRILYDAEFYAYPEALQLLAEDRVRLVSVPGSEYHKTVIMPKQSD